MGEITPIINLIPNRFMLNLSWALLLRFSRKQKHKPYRAMYKAFPHLYNPLFADSGKSYVTYC